jgi:predicted Zn-dependent protease
LSLTWNRPIGDANASAIETAILAWIGTPRLQLTQVPMTSSSSITLQSGTYSWLASCCYGQAQLSVVGAPPPIQLNTTYLGAVVYLHTPAMNTLATTQRRAAVVSHELGHVFGLYHAPNPGVPTIMAGNYLDLAGPQNFDRNSYGILYP